MPRKREIIIIIIIPQVSYLYEQDREDDTLQRL